MMSSRQKSSAPEDPQQELKDEDAFSGPGEKDEAMEEVGGEDEYSMFLFVLFALGYLSFSLSLIFHICSLGKKDDVTDLALNLVS